MTRTVPSRCTCGSRSLSPVHGRAEWECVACGKRHPETEAVSPEAARDRISLSDADREAKRDKMHGTLLSPDEAERVRRMLDEPEAAPPRATTPEPMTEERLARIRDVLRDDAPQDRPWRVAYLEDVAALLGMLSAPSRERGALLDEYREAAWAYGNDGAHANDMKAWMESARAAVNRHIASLERDAARMREENALLRNVEAAARRLPRATPRGGGAGTLHAFTITAGGVWANDIALTKLDEYRAALVPSGEPTATDKDLTEPAVDPTVRP